MTDYEIRRHALTVSRPVGVLAAALYLLGDQGSFPGAIFDAVLVGIVSGTAVFTLFYIGAITLPRVAMALAEMGGDPLMIPRSSRTADVEEVADFYSEDEVSEEAPVTSILHQLKIRVPEEWADRVDWLSLAKYVTETEDPKSTRDALVRVGVPARVFSPQSDDTISVRFLDGMREIGFVADDGRWTRRSIFIFKDILEEAQNEIER